MFLDELMYLNPCLSFLAFFGELIEALLGGAFPDFSLGDRVCLSVDSTNFFLFHFFNNLYIYYLGSHFPTPGHPLHRVPVPNPL